MRKDILALGMFVMFLGLVFLRVSSIAIRQEPLWLDVANFSSQTNAKSLSVEGDLKNGARFRVMFDLVGYEQFWEDHYVLISLTDPSGHTIYFPEIDVGSYGAMSPPPVGIANDTGLYKVDAEAWGVSLRDLVLQRENELIYPYSLFFPLGIATFLSGTVISLVSVKISRRKRIR